MQGSAASLSSGLTALAANQASFGESTPHADLVFTDNSSIGQAQPLADYRLEIVETGRPLRYAAAAALINKAMERHGRTKAIVAAGLR